MNKTILEIIKIQHMLEVQDELDKESIFLLGAKESKVPLVDQDRHSASNPNVVVTLDRSCVTCSDNSLPITI